MSKPNLSVSFLLALNALLQASKLNGQEVPPNNNGGPAVEINNDGPPDGDPVKDTKFDPSSKPNVVRASLGEMTEDEQAAFSSPALNGALREFGIPAIQYKHMLDLGTTEWLTPNHPLYRPAKGESLNLDIPKADQPLAVFFPTISPADANIIFDSTGKPYAVDRSILIPEMKDGKKTGSFILVSLLAPGTQPPALFINVSSTIGDDVFTQYLNPAIKSAARVSNGKKPAIDVNRTKVIGVFVTVDQQALTAEILENKPPAYAPALVDPNTLKFIEDPETGRKFVVGRIAPVGDKAGALTLSLTAAGLNNEVADKKIASLKPGTHTLTPDALRNQGYHYSQVDLVLPNGNRTSYKFYTIGGDLVNPVISLPGKSIERGGM